MQPSLIKKDEVVYYGYQLSKFKAIECGHKDGRLRFILTRLPDEFPGAEVLEPSRKQVVFIFDEPSDYETIERLEIPEMDFKGFKMRLRPLGNSLSDVSGFSMG